MGEVWIFSGTTQLVKLLWSFQGQISRGGSRMFLRRGAPLRNGVADWRGKQILRVNTEKKASSWGGGGGGVHRVSPPSISTPDI